MNNDVDTLNDEIARKCSASLDSMKKIIRYVYEVKTDSSCDHNKTKPMLNQIMREKVYLKIRERLGDQPPPQLPPLPLSWYQKVLSYIGIKLWKKSFFWYKITNKNSWIKYNILRFSTQGWNTEQFAINVILSVGRRHKSAHKFAWHCILTNTNTNCIETICANSPF